ncbi:SpaA isopeptide-forming pilin-related protein [Paenibacillus marinisediminis]
MFNLLLPASFVSASDKGNSGASAQESVTQNVYGSDQDGVTQAVYGSIKENIITSVVIKDEAGNLIQNVRPDQNEKVTINFTWKLPAGHTYHAGDTFMFELPDQFQIYVEQNDELDGGVGTYHVTPEGLVTFTFNEEINDGDELDGYFYVWRYFDKDNMSGSTQQKIPFNFAGNQVTIPVHFKSTDTTEMNKSGVKNKPTNPNKIDWSVDINKGEKSIKNAVFKDKFSIEGQPNATAGLDMVMNSIQVYRLQVMLNGDLVQEATPIPESEYVKQKTADGFELQLGDITNAYRIVYTTDITKTDDVTFKNNAVLTGDDLATPMSKSATVSVSFNKPLTKKVAGYDASKQEINWEIEYNYSKRDIDAVDAWIKDTFDTKLVQLVPGSLKVYDMTIDDNGSAVPTGKVLEAGIDYVLTDKSDGFEIKFNQTGSSSAAYKVAYTTSAKDRVHDKVTVTNTAEIPNTDSQTISRDMNQVIFHKYPGNIDYKEKTLEWILTLNEDNAVMENVVITDSFANQGLELIPGSLSIDGLDPKTDYKLEPNKDYNTGFKITFLHDINTSHVIRYKTKFDPTIHDIDGIKKITYKNDATLNWDVNGTTKEIKKDATHTLDNFTKDNGQKTGSYNAKTKEITWTIDVNYNLHNVSKAIVRDFYSTGQNWVDNSLTIHQLNLTGGSNGVEVGNKLDEKLYTFTQMKNDKGEDGFEVKFVNPINSAYRITYKTSLKGLFVHDTYSNNATMYDADPSKTLFNKSTTVEPTHGGEYVSKTGGQGTGAESELANWKIEINQGQSHIEDAILTDTLSANQILLPDSFQLYHAVSDENGNLTQGSLVKADEYTLKIQGNSYTLTFKQPIETAYTLKYKSFINAGNGEKITNNASFKGKSSATVDNSNNVEIVVVFAGAGGGATAGRGDLQVVKVEAGTNKPLPGAKFGLYDKSGNILLQELVTDENGVAVFKDYKYKEYMLKELSAPAGYLLDEEYKVGKKITFNASLPSISVSNVKGNWNFELTKVDQDDDTLTLEGAVFKLQKKDNGTTYSDVPGKTDLKTNADGKLYLTDLAPGDYQLIEVQAPHGYKLDATPIQFTIDAKQVTPKTRTMKNEALLGSIELLKVDADNHSPLAGAQFELRNEKGVVLQSGLTTNQDGVLTIPNLKYGVYQLVETKAPEGYKLSSQPLTFEINGVSTLKKEFSNELLVGSVKLTKTEKGLPSKKLAGAKFRILDANKEPLKDKAGQEMAELVTDKDGELLVTDLVPGMYYMQETAAPNGYYLSKDLTPFEVVADSEATVTVENTRVPFVPNPDPKPDPVGSVKLTKTEKGLPSKKLAGAKFRILDANKEPLKDKTGQEMAELVTGDNGELLVTGLVPGMYYMQETAAPNGYYLSKDLTPFKVVADSEAAITVENTRVPVDPKPDPDPEKPVDPEKPTDPTTDPEKPIDPGKPVDPVDPQDPTTPDKEANTGDMTGETGDNGKTDPDKSQKEPTSKPDSNKDSSGNVLPKTGEESRLPLQLLGFGLIAAGIALFAIRKRLVSNQ